MWLEDSTDSELFMLQFRPTGMFEIVITSVFGMIGIVYLAAVIVALFKIDPKPGHIRLLHPRGW